jgi:lipoprotein-releasing system permease protein
MEWFIALRYLKGKRKFQFVNIIAYISASGVLLGSLVLVVALSVANGFEKEVRDRIVGMFAHARIMQYFGRPLENADSLRQIILKTPGITGAAPYLSGKGSVEYDGAQEGVLIMGIDDSLERTVTDLARTITHGKLALDSALSINRKRYPGVLIGSGLSDKLGIREGGELILGTLSAQGGDEADPLSRIRAGKYTVAGIFETGMYEYDLSLVYISLRSAQELFQVRGVEGLQVRTADLFSADKTVDRAKTALGGYPFRVVDWKNQNKSLFKWMKLEKLIIFIVVSMIIVVAAFNIICSLIMIILEKRREIGILVGMGASSSSIMRIFLLNGIIIGLVGSTLGVVIGTLLCYAQYHWGLISLPGDIYFIDKVPILIDPVDILAIYGSANVICFLATIFPSRIAAGILPADSLRYE